MYEKRKRAKTRRAFDAELNVKKTYTTGAKASSAQRFSITLSHNEPSRFFTVGHKNSRLSNLL